MAKKIGKIINSLTSQKSPSLIGWSWTYSTSKPLVLRLPKTTLCMSRHTLSAHFFFCTNQVVDGITFSFLINCFWWRSTNSENYYFVNYLCAYQKKIKNFPRFYSSEILIRRSFRKPFSFIRTKIVSIDYTTKFVEMIRRENFGLPDKTSETSTIKCNMQYYIESFIARVCFIAPFLLFRVLDFFQRELCLRAIILSNIQSLITIIMRNKYWVCENKIVILLFWSGTKLSLKDTWRRIYFLCAWYYENGEILRINSFNVLINLIIISKTKILYQVVLGKVVSFNYVTKFPFDFTESNQTDGMSFVFLVGSSLEDFITQLLPLIFQLLKLLSVIRSVVWGLRNEVWGLFSFIQQRKRTIIAYIRKQINTPECRIDDD